MCESDQIKEDFDLLAMMQLEVDCCKKAIEWLISQCRNNFQTIALPCHKNECPPVARSVCPRYIP